MIRRTLALLRQVLSCAFVTSRELLRLVSAAAATPSVPECTGEDPRGRHLSSSGPGVMQRPYAHRQQQQHWTWTPPTRSRQHYEYEYERHGDDEDRLRGERGGGEVGGGGSGQGRGRRPPLKRHRSDDRERVLDRHILSRFDPPSRPLPVSTTPPASGDSDDTDSQDWA